MKMMAAVTRAVGGVQSIEQLELEDPRQDEILVRVVAVGICHTDVGMRDQVYPVPQPIVLGHEGAGIVERVGAGVSTVQPGDHVVMSFNSCGACASCLSHRNWYCHDSFGRNFGGARADGSSALSSNGSSVHGNFFGQSSFATYALCNQRNIVKVPRDAPLELLGPLACGVQTGAGSIINALRVGAGQTIAVFGTGAVGLSAIMAARLVGASTIIGVDIQPSRLALALELGATHIIDGSRQDTVAEIMRITGTGVDFVLETTASVAVMRQAMLSLTFYGECAIVGASRPGTELPLDVVHLMTGGRKIRGIIEGESVSSVFIPQLIELHRQGRFPFDRMVKFYDFENIEQAMRDNESGKVIKPIVRMPKA